MGWDNIAEKTAEETDNELQDRELALLSDTQLDWEELKPDNVDEELYKKLTAIISTAIENNENIAVLKDRILDLGKEGITLAKKISATVVKL